MMKPKFIRLVSCLVCATLICGCRPGPRIDSRTGKPMMAGPWENRDVTLESFDVDFLGRHRIRHKFINGVNIKRCYRAALEEGRPRIITITNHFGQPHPAIISNRHPEGLPNPIGLLGTPGYHIINLKEEGKTTRVYMPRFNPLCGDDFAGGNGIYLSIRNESVYSIDNVLEKNWFMYVDPDRAFQSACYLEEPQTRRVGRNMWTTYISYFPTFNGDALETWMTPIGDSGYHIAINFGFYLRFRDHNTEDYQRARRLMDDIIQSVEIEPQDPKRNRGTLAVEQQE